MNEWSDIMGSFLTDQKKKKIQIRVEATVCLLILTCSHYIPLSIRREVRWLSWEWLRFLTKLLVSLSYREIHHINFVSWKQLFQTCKDKRRVLSRFSHVWLCVTLWAIVPQAPLSMAFSRQEYLSGFPFPSPGKCSKPLSSKPLCTLVLHGYLIYWT